MATSMEVRLAPVTARDGVDTRKKDNSVMPAGGSGKTTRLGAGDHVRDAQTAAIAYLVPPGAEVEGSAMNAFFGLSRRENTPQSNDITIGIVLIPEPAIDVMALINRATDMAGNPEWEAFWAKHYTSNLRIRIPAEKPCKCVDQEDDTCTSYT